MRFDFLSGTFTDISLAGNQAAVIGSDRSLSWEELAKEVEQLKTTLLQTGIVPGHPVMIHGHKEAGFVVAMLACVSANLPYIPIDINVPKARCQKIAQRSGSQLLIPCQESHPFGEIPIEVTPAAQVAVNTTANFTQSVHHRPNDPIRYIIFTSGSTGEPKGVQITAAAVASYLEWVDRDFGLQTNDVFLNQAPFSFDLSVYDLYISLHRGGTLVLSTAEQLSSTEVFFPRILTHQGTVWVSTPSAAYRYLTDPGFNQEALPSIHTFLFCGETLPNRTARLLLERFPTSRVLNSYGPTEATVATTLVDITAELVAECDPLPVGIPKFSSELRIEKSDPLEEWGEIIILGNNVSIGYFEDPELNTQKFLELDGKRAFRTGDLGRFEGPQLYFGGRNDDQIKLNGFRIELGDITTQVLQLPGVKEAVTLPLKQRETVKRIIAIVQLEKDHAAEPEDLEKLRQQLTQLLPAYMIPSELCATAEFPYTNNHKIDRKELLDRYRKRIL